jgi:transcriptional regulator NrdR family protein
MKCPKCSSTHNTVKRSNANGRSSDLDLAMDQRRRVRECSNCGHEWHTLEVTEFEALRLRKLAHQATMEGAKR